MNTDFVVNDQMLMKQAKNYNYWLFTLIKEWINGSALEIGSGIGNMTELVLSESKNIQSLTCVEIDPDCCAELKRNSFILNSNINVEIINSDFMDLNIEKKFDTIFSFNVFEHIEDDILALRKIWDLLNPEGKVITFVPACKVLFGSMDEMLKHFRRYSKQEIFEKMNNIGFNIVNLRYYNTLGFFGWFINNKIFKIKSQKMRQIKLFDKYTMPIQSKIEANIKIPFGQNLFCVAQKKGL